MAFWSKERLRGLLAVVALMSALPLAQSAASVTTVPSVPSVPVVPALPNKPSVPVVPAVPNKPSVPVVPAEPNKPSVPVVPAVPNKPSVPVVPAVADAVAVPDAVREGHNDLERKLQRLQEQRRLCAKCDCYALRRSALNATVRVTLDENLDDVPTSSPPGSAAPPAPTISQVLVINCTERLLAEELPRWSWPARLSAGEVVASETWTEFRGGDLSGVARLPHLPFRLTRLSLADNRLKSVAPRAFANLASLQALDLQHNFIDDMPHDAFVGLVSLERLNLSRNSLGRRPLSGDLLSQLQKLSSVSLAHNQLRGELNGNTLPWSGTVQDLDLSHNTITSVSAGAWMRLSGLKRLNLSHNRIASLTPHAFGELRSLEWLDLSWNVLETLPTDSLSGLGTLHSLHSLHLHHNALQSLGSMMQLGALTALHLSHNPLGREDGGLEGQRERGVALPAGLQELDLSHCGLRGFQARSWGGLHAVRRLLLAGNHISVLDDIAHLDALAELDASNNSLTLFPAVSLPQLQRLDLSSNQLERGPVLMAPRLAALSLDGNPVEELRLGVPPSLAALSLQAMPQLRRLAGLFLDPADTNHSAACLSLLLSNNHALVDVGEDAFSSLNICQLNMSHNALSWLPPKLADWRGLQLLDLQGNPWTCSCRLQWMLDTVVRILYRTRPELLQELRCSSPVGVAGRRLVHWYNHTGLALCNGEAMDMRAAGMVTLKLSPATLAVIISLGLLAIGLVVLGILAHRKYVDKRRARNRRF